MEGLVFELISWNSCLFGVLRVPAGHRVLLFRGHICLIISLNFTSDSRAWKWMLTLALILMSVIYSEQTIHLIVCFLNSVYQRPVLALMVRSPPSSVTAGIFMLLTILSSPHRRLPSSRDGGGAGTGTACGGWHRGHHLFSSSSCPVQYNGCLLRQQTAQTEAQAETR